MTDRERQDAALNRAVGLTDQDLVAAVPALRSVAMALTRRDPSKADDLIQDTCVRALRFREDYVAQGKGSEARWLKQIMRNQHNETCRYERVRSCVQSVDFTAEEERGMEASLLSEAVAKAITPPGQYDTTLLGEYLRMFSQRSVSQCAAELGVCKSTAYKRIKSVFGELEGEY